jgi:hypothetical protein
MSSERVLLPLLAVPSHYKLELVPDLEALTFQASEEIHVNVTESISEVTLHSKEIQILTAKFQPSQGEDIDAEEICYNPKATTV